MKRWHRRSPRCAVPELETKEGVLARLDQIVRLDADPFRRAQLRGTSKDDRAALEDHHHGRAVRSNGGQRHRKHRPRDNQPEDG